MMDEQTFRALIEQLQDDDPEKRKKAADMFHGFVFQARTNEPYELAKQFLADADPLQVRLGDWLWSPFKGPSLVVRVDDPRNLRRDEEAVIDLARRVPWDNFPWTCFDHVKLGGFDLVVKEREVVAICFVGRLGLYGQQTVRRWQMKNSRFRFGKEGRPAGLQPGCLDPDFHVILENMGTADEPIRHETVDENGRRTDYGLVQSYVVRYNDRDIRVVICAGCTVLATQAATYWAGRTLFVPNHEGRFKMLHPRVRGDSRMEALIQATADIPPLTDAWKLGESKLLDLRLGDRVWNQREYDWDRRTAKRITLSKRRGASGNLTNDDVSDVLFDGKSLKMQKGRENFRLMVALCRLAHKHKGRVAIARLASDQWIWDEGHKEFEKDLIRYAKNRLFALKKAHLGQTLVIEHGHFWLKAKVQ